MELRDLRLALRRHWLVAVLAFLACLSVGIAGGYLPTKTYTTSASVSVEPVVTPSGGNVQTANFLIPSIIARVESASFRHDIESVLSKQDLTQPVTLTAENELGTGIIKVTASSPSPGVASRWASQGALLLVNQEGSRQAGVLNFSMIQPASVPSVPSSPKPVPVLLGTIVIGIIVAALAALGAARLRVALDAEDEIRNRLRVPLLGQVPRLRALRKRHASILALVDSGQAPAFVDSVQRLRTHLELLFGEHRPPAIAFVSLNPAEGKSTITAGVGWSLASVGEPVHILDADLRRPAVHERLGEPFGEGLGQVANGAPVIVRPTKVPFLDFVAAGVPDRHPADVVTMALPPALEALAARGGMVLIDCPPLRDAAEAQFILALAKYAVIIVDVPNLKSKELEQAVDRMREAGVTVLGVVLNRVRQSTRRTARGSYHYPTPTAPGPDTATIVVAEPHRARDAVSAYAPPEPSPSPAMLGVVNGHTSGPAAPGPDGLDPEGSATWAGSRWLRRQRPLDPPRATR